MNSKETSAFLDVMEVHLDKAVSLPFVWQRSDQSKQEHFALTRRN